MRIDSMSSSQVILENKNLDIVALGSLIVDDIVFPNGGTCMERIGGSAAYAAVGARLTGARTGIWAFAGQDYFTKIKQHLESKGINTFGLISRDVQQPRAWQIFSPDATRTEVFRTPWLEVRSYSPLPEEWPKDVTCSVGYLFWAKNIPETIRAFRRAGAQFIVWEPPDDLINSTRDRENIISLLPLVDAVCPNVKEWAQLFNIRDEDELIHLVLSTGVKLIALRLGGAGSILATECCSVRLPVEPIQYERDFTGAGNSYVGALAAAIVLYGLPNDRVNLQKIGAHAAVAATMTIEARGLPSINRYKIQSFHRRVRRYLQQLS